MAEIIKTIEEIEDLFRVVVLTILGLDIDTNHKRVRFPWGSNLKAGIGSAPSWNRTEDVCVIYALPQDDVYNRTRNRKYEDRGGRDLITVDEHTDIHHMMFANYGPHAYECARDIRDGLFRDDIRRILKKSNFYMVPDVSAIKKVPDIYEGQWWNRVDFSAEFNEYVRRENTMMTIEEISIKATEVTSNGQEISLTDIIERGSELNG